MKQVWMIALGAAALAGCQQQQPSEPQNDTGAANAAAISPANNMVMKVDQLSDQQRNVVMIRAVLDAGFDECTSVTKSEKMDANTWRAECKNGDKHLVRIQPDGNAQVISRTNS